MPGARSVRPGVTCGRSGGRTARLCRGTPKIEVDAARKTSYYLPFPPPRRPILQSPMCAVLYSMNTRVLPVCELRGLFGVGACCLIGVAVAQPRFCVTGVGHASSQLAWAPARTATAIGSCARSVVTGIVTCADGSPSTDTSTTMSATVGDSMVGSATSMVALPEDADWP